MPEHERRFDATSGELASVLPFLDWMHAQGLIRANSKDSYKTSCRKVLALEPNWQQSVLDIDIEFLLERFREAPDLGLSDKTAYNYARRCWRAMNWYRIWLTEPDSLPDFVGSKRRFPS